jgi:hypothetical protein
MRSSEVYLVENMKGRTSWRTSLRWESNIKVDITEVRNKDFDFLDMVQDKLECKLLLRIFFDRSHPVVL